MIAGAIGVAVWQLADAFADPGSTVARLATRVPSAGVYDVRLTVASTAPADSVVVVANGVARDRITLRGPKPVTVSFLVPIDSRRLHVTATARNGRPTLALSAAYVATLQARAVGPDPSGVPMPRGNLPGWRQVFAEDFTSTSLSDVWSTYNGEPGNDPGGWWDRSHIVVSDGELRLETHVDSAACSASAGCHAVDNQVSGGLKLRLAQTYGKYLVRLRADNALGIAIVGLLWPASNTWPPEVDFVEDNGASPRHLATATLHYGSNDTQVPRTLRINLAEWHTFGVEWSPGRLVYTVDGRVWATVSNPNVPAIPMQLALQAQAWACGISSWETCPNSQTPAASQYDIDWVVVYAGS
jgi:hypothetical protein